MSEHERCYTPAELARLWNCNTEYVRTLLRSGKLDGFLLGTVWRIPPSAVAEYQERQKLKKAA
jgi:excisionase family DNA binding protein